MKPSHWICGGEDYINCEYWDSVNGCWRNEKDAMECEQYISLANQAELDEPEDNGPGA